MTTFDYLIVLCASTLGPDGQFTEITADGTYLGGQLRMDAAVAAYRAGATLKIIVVGGGVDEPESAQKWLKVTDMKQFLVQNGVPESAIICVASQPDTLGNLRALYHVCRDLLEGYTVGILTNYYHLPRAMRMAQDSQFDWNVKFVPLAAEAYVTPSTTDKITRANGLTNRIIKETSGLRQWEEGTYMRQFLDKAQWQGELLSSN